MCCTGKQYCHNECSLCGVSFQIGRLRTANEPVTAAWEQSDSHHQGATYCSFDRLKWAGRCDDDSGCMLAFRYDVIKLENSEDIKLVGQQSKSELKQKDHVSDGECPADDKLSEYIKIVYGPSQPEKFLYIGERHVWEMREIQNIIQKSLEQEGFVFKEKHWLKLNVFEHISGPGCRSDPFLVLRGYSGSRISPEEMETCHIAQCIMPPGSLSHLEQIFQPQPEEKEKPTDQAEDTWGGQYSGEWCVSSLCTGEHCYVPLSHMLMIGHNGHVPGPRYYGTGRAPFRGDYMRFHPACLEVFKRAAVWKHGRYDLGDLGKWFLATMGFMTRLTRHEAVDKVKQDLSACGVTGHLPLRAPWIHHPGDEWLVANPCVIPGLERFVDRLRQPSIEHLSLGSSLVNVLNKRPSIKNFTSLPTEIYLMIFDQLQLVEVVNVEMAFPELRKITNPYAGDRLNSDWPWLWELWCDRPYSIWTTKRMAEVSDLVATEVHRHWDAYGRANLESKKQMVSSIYQEIATESGQMPEPVPPFAFDDSDDVDPVKFVAEFVKAVQGGELKGLQNRKRIWENCVVILDQIDLLKEYADEEWDVRARAAQGKWTPADSKELEILLYGNVERRLGGFLSARRGA